MDKETLSNYGWIVICVLVLAVMIALATPFGNFVRDAVASTTQGLFDLNKNALDAANVPGLTIEDQKFNKETTKFDPSNHSGIIPEGGIYYVGVTGLEFEEYDTATAVYTAGDKFPEIQTGDVYVYGDYEYKYNYQGGFTSQNNIAWPVWEKADNMNGWGVRFIGNATKPGKIIPTINDKNTTSMVLAFSLMNAESVQDASEISIPETVTNMEKAFFWNPSLTTAPRIPSKVENLNDAFSCTSLTGTIIIDANPSMYEGCFYYVDMSKLTIEGQISKNVLNAIGSTGKNWVEIN